MSHRSEAKGKHAGLSHAERIGILFGIALSIIGLAVSWYAGYNGTLAVVGVMLTLGGGLLVWAICRIGAPKSAELQDHAQSKSDA